MTFKNNPGWRPPGQKVITETGRFQFSTCHASKIPQHKDSTNTCLNNLYLILTKFYPFPAHSSELFFWIKEQNFLLAVTLRFILSKCIN
jgi:hypothetical protein